MEGEPHMDCCAGGFITARSNPGEQETPFPYCFKEGCVFFLLDFIPFPPPFFSSLCPTVTNAADLMLRVKLHLAWPAVGLFADLLPFRWKPEHKMGNSLHILSHPLPRQLCKISSFTEVSFCLLDITVHASKTATLNKGVFPLLLTLWVLRNIPSLLTAFQV